MADSKQWYVQKGKKTHGPFTSRQLKKLAKESQIRPDTSIRKGNTGDWMSASKASGLFAPAGQQAELVPVKKAAKPVSPLPVKVARAEVVAVPARVPCPMCGEEIAATAKKCRHCNEYLDGRPSHHEVAPVLAPVAPAHQPAINVVVNQQANLAATATAIAGGGTVKKWNRFVAILLSFFIPGLGQLYKGQPVNGIIWFVLAAVGYTALLVPGIIIHLCCIAGAAMGDPHK